jgi:hypothetical protein
MTRHALLAALLLTVAAAAASGKELDNPAETTWRQVTWDDFKGGDSTAGRWDTGAWAHLASGIDLDAFESGTRVDDDGSWLATPIAIEAYAVMDKFLSGVARGARKDEVLAHEQLHFDVTEALARRLTARLLGMVGRGDDADAAMRDLQGQVQRAYDETIGELRAYQQRYDSDTRHGGDRKKQKRWSQQIGELFAEATAELAKARSSS